MLVMKVCTVCGKLFEKTGNRQVCCSKECACKRHSAQRLSRDRAAREAQAVRAKCLTCGKEFVKSQPKQKCCCIRCKRKHDLAVRHEKSDANPKMKKCVVCGKEFRVLHGAQVVCSKECKRIHANALAREAAKRKAVHRFVKCLGCGKVFQVVGAYYRYCPVCRVERRKNEDTTIGLTYEERRAIAYAQDRLTQEELYQASQTWTPKQHKYALARWRQKNGMGGGFYE